MTNEAEKLPPGFEFEEVGIEYIAMHADTGACTQAWPGKGQAADQAWRIVGGRVRFDQRELAMAMVIALEMGFSDLLRDNRRLGRHGQDAMLKKAREILAISKEGYQ